MSFSTRSGSRETVSSNGGGVGEDEDGGDISDADHRWVTVAGGGNTEIEPRLWAQPSRDFYF